VPFVLYLELRHMSPTDGIRKATLPCATTTAYW
jgi:hypothetical protein